MKVKIQFSQEGNFDKYFLEFETSAKADDMNALICSVSDRISQTMHEKCVKAKVGYRGITFKANRPIQMRVQVGTSVLFETHKANVKQGCETEVKFNSISTTEGKIKFARQLKWLIAEYAKDIVLVDFGDDVLSKLEMGVPISKPVVPHAPAH